jgi:hypothetical protein
MFKRLIQARIVHKEKEVGTCFASQNEESLVIGTKRQIQEPQKGNNYISPFMPNIL